VVLVLVPGALGDVISPEYTIAELCQASDNETVEVPTSIDGLVTRRGGEVEEVVCAERDRYSYETPPSSGWGLDLDSSDVVFLLPYAVLVGGLLVVSRRGRSVRELVLTAGVTTGLGALTGVGVLVTAAGTSGALWATVFAVVITAGIPVVLIGARNEWTYTTEVRDQLAVHGWTLVSVGVVVVMVINAYYVWIA